MNPNIALGVQRPRFNTTQDQANALAIQNSRMQQQQNALALQLQQQGMAQREQVRNALAGMDPTSPGYTQALARAQVGAGDLEGAASTATKATRQQADLKRIDLDNLGILKTRAEITASYYNPDIVRDQQSLDAINAELSSLGMKPLVTTYDERQIRSASMMALSASERINAELKERGFKETERHNRAMEARPPTGGSPYYSFIPTADGIVAGNARTGEVAPVSLGGKPVIKSSDDPELQGRVAGSKAQAGATGKAEGEYWASRPAAKAARESLLADIESLQASPGLKNIFGAVQGRVPDVMPEARDARARLQKVVGGMSLQGREKLQGSGAISDFESRMLQNAATILSDTSISDEAAVAEITKLLDDLKTGRYSPGAPSQSTPGAGGAAPGNGIKFLGFE